MGGAESERLAPVERRSVRVARSPGASPVAPPPTRPYLPEAPSVRNAACPENDEERGEPRSPPRAREVPRWARSRAPDRRPLSSEARTAAHAPRYTMSQTACCKGHKSSHASLDPSGPPRRLPCGSQAATAPTPCDGQPACDMSPCAVALRKPVDGRRCATRTSRGEPHRGRRCSSASRARVARWGASRARGRSRPDRNRSPRPLDYGKYGRLPSHHGGSTPCRSMSAKPGGS
jgi:hypothetical protein